MSPFTTKIRMKNAIPSGLGTVLQQPKQCHPTLGSTVPPCWLPTPHLSTFHQAISEWKCTLRSDKWSWQRKQGRSFSAKSTYWNSSKGLPSTKASVAKKQGTPLGTGKPGPISIISAPNYTGLGCCRIAVQKFWIWLQTRTRHKTKITQFCISSTVLSGTWKPATLIPDSCTTSPEMHKPVLLTYCFSSTAGCLNAEEKKCKLRRQPYS